MAGRKTLLFCYKFSHGENGKQYEQDGKSIGNPLKKDFKTFRVRGKKKAQSGNLKHTTFYFRHKRVYSLVIFF